MPVPSQPPVIVLAIAREAISAYQHLPRLGNELKRIQEQLKDAERNRRCELVVLPSVTVEDITRNIQAHRNHIAIFHFAGHADGESFLVERESGEAQIVDAAGFAEFLASQPKIPLVFLNGCATEAHAAELHKAGVRAVIATSDDVRDDSALQFAETFYGGLATGASIEEAFNEAKATVRMVEDSGWPPFNPAQWTLSADEAAAAWQLPAPSSPPETGPGKRTPLIRPLRPLHFVGRAAELEQILPAVQPRRVVTLCGPGGIGKSALAAQVVWTLAPGEEPPERFPDGIVYHSFYEKPSIPAALKFIAGAFGLEPPVKRGTGLAESVRQWLQGMEALLVLDGAEMVEKLDAVLHAAGGCGVLMTTRRRAQAPEPPFDISPMGAADSMNLLRVHAGSYADDTKAAGEIVERLGGLPLALFLAGHYMIQRHQQAAEYLEFLREGKLTALVDETHPNKSVRYLLEHSLQQVSADARAAFGVAGMLELGPFDREIVAAALGITPASAGNELGQLVDYGLLLRPGTDYQVTHVLAHSYAREYLPPGPQVIGRLVSHFQELSEAESQKNPPDAGVLVRRGGYIFSAWTAAEKAKYSVIVQFLAWLLADNVVQRLTATGDHQQAIQLHGRLEQQARNMEYYQGQGKALGDLGNLYAALGVLDKAIVVFSHQLDLAIQLEDSRAEGDACSNLGRASAEAGGTDEALNLCRKSVAIARALKDRGQIGDALSSLGCALHAAGEYQEALNCQQGAVSMLEECGRKQWLALTLAELAETYLALGEPLAARPAALRAVGIAVEHQYTLRLAPALWVLARTHAALGEAETAVALAKEALWVYVQIEHSRAAEVRRWLKQQEQK